MSGAFKDIMGYKMLGFNVMLNTIVGNEKTVNAINLALGKTIENVNIIDNRLVFQFNDGVKLTIFDDGQSCCEDRYMSTDDDLQDYKGAILVNFELKNAPDINDEYGSHEVQFLDVITSNGVFQLANHNEHNGYYGGFSIVATLNEVI